MQNSKTRNTVLITALLLACGTLASVDAGARGHSRTVQRGGGQGTVSSQRDNARFQSEHDRQWQRDGQGNATGSSSGSIDRANGGSAERQGSYYRNADGSAGHEGTVSATGKNGGTLESSGSTTRDADGNVTGSRDTTATGKNGGTYTGSTTWDNGEVNHTGTVTGANGGTVDVNSDYTRADGKKVDGTRTTTATGKNGGTYEGSTTWTDGDRTHTGACTNSAGESVDCPTKKPAPSTNN